VNADTRLNIKLNAKIDYEGAADCEAHHQYTNLHYHGFEVSPKAPQDDVVSIKVKNGESYQYKVVLPPGHPEGMFWYHPHPHGCSFFQVNAGLSGILIVGDILKQYPEYAGIRERILLLKDGNPGPGGGERLERRVLKFAADPDEPEPDPITVNGMSKPKIAIQTGEKQFFRIGNVGADFFVKIAFKPHVKAEIIAVDGMATDKKIELTPDGWLLSPGSRVEMVVTGPAAGSYEIISKEIPKAMSPPGDTVLAILDAKAGGALKSNAMPMQNLEQGPKARSAFYPNNEEFAGPASAEGCTVHSKPKEDPRTKGCTFVFSEGNNEFKINDKVYQEDVNDVTCKIGQDKLYEWTLCNDTGQYHAFHIHQIHFDVLDIDGKPLEAPVRDVVELPPGVKPQGQPRIPSRVRIKMAFKHDYLAGKFVFHCHMLTHEDKGMMMNIELEK
jgi:FtsP/CotA-like multicopper oxidase with cupredoxin domain